jgi:hypothetical protein
MTYILKRKNMKYKRPKDTATCSKHKLPQGHCSKGIQNTLTQELKRNKSKRVEGLNLVSCGLFSRGFLSRFSSRGSNTWKNNYLRSRG